MEPDFLYNMNHSYKYKLNLVKNEQFYLLEDTKSKKNMEIINPDTIYKCQIWHNILPFSVNPDDKSYCGIGFGDGLKES